MKKNETQEERRLQEDGKEKVGRMRREAWERMTFTEGKPRRC